MKPSDIITLVEDGKLDRILEPLNAACVERLRYLRNARARRNARDFTPGTKVVVVPGIRPKYLVGAEGTVCRPPSTGVFGAKAGYIWVDFDQRIGRYGPVVRMPANCLKRRDA